MVQFFTPSSTNAHHSNVRALDAQSERTEGAKDEVKRPGYMSISVFNQNIPVSKY